MLIQKLRVQRGWSQEELAALGGISVRTIQRLEQGRPASLESLKALAAVFEVDFNRLKDPDMTPPEPREVRADEALALARVRKIKSFYVHVAYYLIIVSGLTVVNALSSPNYWWAAWVAGSWGIGVVANGMQTFDKIPFLNGDWERREVEKLLGRKL